MILNLPEVSAVYHQPDGMTDEEARSRANKIYLVFLTLTDQEGDFTTWKLCRGTQDAYEYARDMIEDDYAIIDFENSYVLVDAEGERLISAIPVYEFLKKMLERGKVIENTGFDLEAYYAESKENESFEEDNNTTQDDERRYGQGDNPVQYTSMNAVDGGEL